MGFLSKTLGTAGCLRAPLTHLWPLPLRAAFLLASCALSGTQASSWAGVALAQAAPPAPARPAAARPDASPKASAARAPAPATPAAADGVGEEPKDWAALEAFEKGLGDLKKTDPEAAVTRYKAFFEGRRKMFPIAGSVVFSRIAELRRDALQQPEQALASYDRGIELYREHPAVVILLEGKAGTLLRQKRAPEASTLYEAHKPQVILAGQSAHPHLALLAALTLYQTAQALDAQGAAGREKLAGVLADALVRMPLFLDDRKQGPSEWFHGWMYNRLIDHHLAQGTPEGKAEALRWAKLGWAGAAFDRGAIERATARLARAWVAQEDFASPRALAKAQEDPAAPSPLRPIPLPAAVAGAGPLIAERAKGLQAKDFNVGDWIDANKAQERIGFHLLRGDAASLLQALEVARLLVKLRPEDPESAGAVARVLKAHDGSTRRANAYLAFLGGTGEDPLPTFQAELEQLKQQKQQAS